MTHILLVLMAGVVLLGAIPMEDMDLIVRPMTREVLINPASPNVPMTLSSGHR